MQNESLLTTIEISVMVLISVGIIAALFMM